MAHNKKENGKFQLVEVIQELRQSLAVASDEGQGKDIRFDVNNVEVELQVAVEKSVSGKGGSKFDFWVLGGVDAEVSGNYKKAATHKIKLNLTPLDDKNPDPETGGPGKIKIKGGKKSLTGK